ncbi:MAG TPA: beta-ketoacyl synthase N-terminal-like domain-containing protein, partial [Kofleriaceae bacterium]|nr:beta-ketoacyl synthase N-terminal-like domain-containing protein [Kofleriaceae bacterium]
MNRAAIVDSVRTGISRAFQGRLTAARPDDMAAHCVDALFARNPWLSRAEVEDCVIGCAFPEGPQGMNLGRNVAVLSRLGRDTAGLTISRYCASGLDAVAHAAARIASGQAEVMVAGGVESISMTLKSVNAHNLFNPAIRDRSPGTYVKMGWDNPATAFWKRAFRTMGETAEIIAEQRGITRAEQDAWAWQSQQRTASAQAAEVFRDEIVALPVAYDDPTAGATAGATPGAALHAVVDRDDA